MNIPIYQVDAFTGEPFRGNPVTGSAHCCLMPYWAEKLGKKELHAYQGSERGGELHQRLAGDRVYIGGEAVMVMKGILKV
jgi:predicted PhzF superfamily epimerase YddE/YHI9